MGGTALALMRIRRTCSARSAATDNKSTDERKMELSPAAASATNAKLLLGEMMRAVAGAGRCDA
jgi:hypothetical protein